MVNIEGAESVKVCGIEQSGCNAVLFQIVTFSFDPQVEDQRNAYNN